MLTTKQTKTFTSLNASNILKLVPEEEIYKYYLGYDFELNKCYTSILRDKDTTPSLNFYYNRRNQLCYKDFGHSQGNVFEFVKNLFSCSYFEALSRINFDFNLGLGFSEAPLRESRIETTKTFKKTNDYFIQVSRREFNDFDLQYWSSYGISYKTLLKYNVIAVSKVWVNKVLKFVSNESNPIYGYLFGNKIKVYRPLSESKWVNNATGDIIQGYEQLPESGEILIITKSLKDVMFFDEHGFPAIAPQGETMHFNETIIIDLKKRFKNIIVIYDNDDTGVKFSTKLTNELNLKYWNIPKSYEEKDPTDFHKVHGKDMTNELLKTIFDKCITQ